MEFALKIPEDMRKKYIERRAQDAEKLASALEEGDLEFLQSVGHQLKGNASTFGYEMLAELGKKMENAASQHSITEGRKCLFALKAWVQDQTQTGEAG